MNKVKFSRLELFMAALIASALAAVISGCATSSVISQMQADPNADLFAVIASTSAADLDAALADAVAHNDVLAMPCYPVIKKYLDILNMNGQVPIKGVFSGYQRARDLRKDSGGGQGIPDDLRLACAAMVQDSKDFILKMAVIAGAAGGSGGAALPFLPK